MNATTTSQTFDDEFTSFASSPYGATGWMTTYPFGGNSTRTLPGNLEVERYNDASDAVNPFSDQNGVLTITARKEPLDYGLQYASGLIDTYKSFSQLYGYFEVRAQLPAGQGLWPAFWLLPADDINTSELDVFEVLGGRSSTLYSTVHGTTGGQSASLLQALSVPDTSDGFHTYGCDWEPDKVTFYMDGAEIASAPTPASMNKPMYMLLNLAVGGSGSWPGATGATTPDAAQMKIDYVRAYATAATRDVEGTAALPGTATLPGDVAVGDGPDALTLAMAEDPFQGDASFMVAVDGQAIGGVLTTTARHDAQQQQLFQLRGSFGAGPHVVSVTFLNPAGGGTPALERNLYLDSITDANGTTAAATELTDTNTHVFASDAQPVSLGSGPDAITLELSEDAYLGDAMCSVAVDGAAIGSPQPVRALHASGQQQTVTIHGTFGAGQHKVTVAFLNDAYGPISGQDRNLYVDSIQVGGQATPVETALYSNGSQDFTFDIANVASQGTPSTTQTTATSDATPADPLVDSSYYLANHPDVADAGVDPAAHYAATGWREGYNPNPLFDTTYYLASNPDVAAAGVDPLQHYETFGWREGRNPDPLFDAEYYLSHNPDVAAAGVDPLQHYEAFGWREGRNPSAAFDTNAYLTAHPDVKAAGVDPLAQYLTAGQTQGYATFPV